MVQLTVIKPRLRRRKFVKRQPIALVLQTGIFKYACLFFAFLMPFIAQAQPKITSFSPATGSVGASVTLAGSGFSAIKTDNTVYFGAVKAIVVDATPNLLTVTVPVGATMDPISVTNANLTAYSGMPFTPSFAACNNVVPSDFGVPASALLPGAPNLVLNGDIDGDKIPDLVTFNKVTVSVHRDTTAANAASPTNFRYTRTDLALPATATAFGGAVADLDGDGQLDVVATGYLSNQFYVFRNNSISGTILFGTRQDMNMPTLGTDRARAVTVADFNGDGKPDLAFACVGSSSICIYLNTSTVGAISFAEALTFNTYNGPWDITNADMDGDGLADLIVSCNTDQRVVVYLNNTSAFSSTLNFSNSYPLPLSGGGLQGVTVGDMNGDGRPDIGVLNNSSNAIHLYRNTSSGSGSLSFDAAVTLGGGSFSGKISLGDLNGDTKPDVVAGGAQDQFYFFTNNSPDNGALSFSTVNSVNSSSIGGNAPTSIAITDLNRDGRSDFVAANNTTEQFDVYFNSLSQLVILNVSKENGKAGDEIELTGTGMGCATSVTLGGIPATIVGTPTANNIKIVVPAGSGSVIIAVKTSGGSAISPQMFTYVTKPTNMKYTPDSVKVVVGTSDLPYLTPTENFSINTGGGDITYTLERTNGSLTGIPITILPSGQIRALSSIVVGKYKIIAIAENTAGKDTAEFILNVLPGVPSDLEYPGTPDPNIFTVNYGTTGNTIPTTTWNGQVGSYAISPVPAAGSGISFDPLTGEISWDGTVAAGTYNYSVTATNDGGTSLPLLFKLVVVPLAPTDLLYAAILPVKFGNIDSTAVPGINWHGKNGSYSISGTGLPSSITINPTTGVIRWNKGVIAATDTVPVGTYVITIKASNTVSPDATATFTLVVQAEKPTDIVYSPMPFNGLYGDGGSSAAPKVNWHGDTGSFLITSTSHPAIIMPDVNTGVITWPTTLPVGTYTIKLKAKNIIDFSDEYVYTLIIKAKTPTGLVYDNQEMTFENLPVTPTTTSPKAPGIDWHGDPGTFSYVSPNSGISVDPTTGVITWKDTLSVGVYTIKIIAQNSAIPNSVFAYFTLTVKAGAPTFSYDPAVTAYQSADSSSLPLNMDWHGNIGSFTIVDVSPASATSAFSLSSTGSGRIRWNTSLAIGTYTVTVKAQNTGGSLTATFNLEVQVGKPSDLSYASHPATANYGSTGNSGTPTVKWHGDTGDFQSVISPIPIPATALTVDAATGIISWDSGLPAGTYTITVRAHNIKGLSDPFIYTLLIKPLTPTGFNYPDGGETRSYLSVNTSSRKPNIDWQGADGTFKIDPAAYVDGLPASITIDPITGIISWPSSLLVKKYTFNVIASNGIGADQVTSFFLTVTAGPAAGLDYQPKSLAVKYGTTGATPVPGIVWYGDIGSFAITSPVPKPAGIDIDAATGVISWDGTAVVSTYPITVTATNSNTTGNATDVFTLIVEAEAPSDLKYSQYPYSADAGNDGVSVKPTVKWHGDVGHFEIVNPTTGFTVDSDGIVHWTKDVAAGTYTINVIAVNSIVGSSNIETLTVKLVIAKPSIKYTPDLVGIQFGTDKYSDAPDIKWHGEIGVVGISGVFVNSILLPTGNTNGITIDDVTGILHFPSTLAFGDNIVVLVVASNTAGQVTTQYTVKVGSGPTDLLYPQKKYSIIEGSTGKSEIPSVNWNGLKGSYYLSGAPAGVTIDPAPDAPGGLIRWSSAVVGGTTYTFTAYAENLVGKSNVETIELEVIALPTATLTGGAAICKGVSKDLSIGLTGKAPWSITYTDGTTPVVIDNIAASPYILKVTPNSTTTYSLVSVTDDNDATNSSLTAKTTVTVNAAVTAAISSGPAGCNSLTSFDITASGGGAGGSYSWSSGQTTEKITVTTSGNYVVTVKDALGCTGTATADIQLNTIPAPPVLATPATTLICQGSSITLTATGTDNYIWSKDGIVIANETSASYKATAAGTYTVVGVNKTTGCTRAATGTGVALTFAQSPDPKFTLDTYCKDVPVHFNNTTVDPTNDFVYLWHFGDGQTGTAKQAVHTYTKAETVMILLDATSKSCPALTKTSQPATVTIEEAAPPVRYEPINALKNRTSPITGRSIGNTYAWTPTDGLNNATISSPIVTPVKEQTYYLKITTKGGCVTVDTQLVRIFSKAEIFVPKGFTPNNDGVNDRMFPIAVGINKLNYFKIFNRWGVLVYETQQAGSSSTGGGWDGTFKGALQPMDAYTWIAEGIDVDGQLIKISGSTVLMR